MKPEEQLDELEEKPDKPQGQLERDTYLAERRSLIELEGKSGDSFDKTVIALASGGLAGSIGFLKDITPTPIPWTLLPLVISWLALGASLMAILVSFKTSAEGLARQREILDDVYVRGDANADKANQPSAATGKLNNVSLWCLGIGVVGIMAFAGGNLANIGSKAHDKVGETIVITNSDRDHREGIPAPRLPKPEPRPTPPKRPDPPPPHPTPGRIAPSNPKPPPPPQTRSR